MEISTQTWAEAANTLATVLFDSVQIYDVAEPVTTGVAVTRALTPVGEPMPGLVQTTTLANAAESLTINTYSVKVARGTDISAGQAVKVLECQLEPSLVGKVLLLDKVSQNGMALIRKAVASDATVVNQEGKEALSV
ncbi:hypothetical protein FDJ34_gp09 [Microbacterium phage Eleri]|uniref:Uncharacterized protein n=1 Tax=Microbacterium phage Eleri TaxID=2079581 RepID=A0A2L0HNP7_9CAUD|nr:hypothetical protein FDJ34_gp09 [Microbacterium phage Eleri]AUX83347.1 hypothetical protein SEA_ELERI_9 [Microbacterium phage Eleri]